MAKKKKDSPQPQVYPNNFFGVRDSSWRTDYDIDEIPVRSPVLAERLLDLINHCPEAAAALEVICAYTLSSGTGDELGFAVVEDPMNPKPEQVAIANTMLGRIGDIFQWWQVVWRMMAWGDAFAVMAVDLSKLEIQRVQVLPTWQMFRMEDVYGNLSHFEQRIPYMQQTVIEIPELITIHWAYNKRYLYGRSVFYEALRDWDVLKRADDDLDTASREASIIPTMHTMPPGTDENYKRAYREDHEQRKKRGIISDVYLTHGASVQKPYGAVSTFPLNSIQSHWDARRLRIAARSRVPLYLLGVETKFAREIAYQPAIAFVVQVGVIRQLFSSGLRQLINMELALKGIPQPWHYRLVFPTINVNPWRSAIDDDVDEPGVNDVQLDKDFTTNGRDHY